MLSGLNTDCRMRRTVFLALFLILPFLPAKAQFIWDLEHLEKVRGSLQEEPFYAKAWEALKAEADEDLDAEPLSVMMKTKTPASGDKHDYMSLARYYWPDPSKPDGLPYISRDGISNPELKELDRNRLSETADRVTTLSLAWFFSGDEKYARKATELLRVWFLNEDTKMNPNLEYAQMVPGRDNGKGRCYGVLDSYSFVEMLDAVELLDTSKSFTDEDSQGIRAWFGELLDWMLTSQQGKDECSQANNHGTAYDAQVISLALHAGKDDIAREIIMEFPQKRVFTQIEPDGRQPHELRRTIAYHYSWYNLTHYIDIYLMADKLGIDIDQAESEDGRSFYKALDFLVPYLGTGGETWPYQQISGWNGVEQNLYRDLYRTATLLDTTRTDYLELFRKNARVALGDRFNLLYMNPEDK